MIRHDATDPETIPEPVRRRALAAAEDAIDRSLRCDGYRLDLFARLELLDLAVDDAIHTIEDKLPPVH
jgi:hypothetical protein